MSIDFTLPPDVVAIRDQVRRFMDEEVRPVESRLRELADPRAEIQKLRDKAKREKLWNPHLPAEWGGLGLGPMAMATVSAECGRTRWGAYVLNSMAPDVNHLWPLMIQWSPRFTALVRICVGSEPATSGSVIAKHERTLPSASGRRYLSFCSGVAL